MDSSLEPKRRGKKPDEAEPKDAKEEKDELLLPAQTTRMTRSRTAPDWTTNELLILVNEIAAMEGDWLKLFSSTQKWKIVADNCNVLDTRRNPQQCRGKWGSLLSEYNCIKQWNSRAVQCGGDLYWTLEPDKRNFLRLPVSFDYEVFKAIDTYVRSQADELDTDTETDPEAEAELLHVIARLGSKRRKRRLSALDEEAELPNGLSQPRSPDQKPPLYTQEEESEENRLEETRQEKEQAYETRRPEEEHAHEGHKPKEEHAHEMREPEEELAHETCHPEEEQAHEMRHTQEKHANETCQPKEKDAHCWAKKDEIVREEEVHESQAEEGFHKTLEDNKEGAAQGICREQKVAQNDDSETTTTTTTLSFETEGEKAPEKNNSMGEQRPYKRGRKPRALVQEEEMVDEVFENAQLMLAAATSNHHLEHELGDAHSNDAEGSKREFARNQADKLTECLDRIVNILDGYPYLIKKYG